MQERAEAAQRELGEVKERAWALLEQKEDELRVVRARPALPNCTRCTMSASIAHDMCSS